MKKLFCIIGALALLLSGCTGLEPVQPGNETQPTAPEENNITVPTDEGPDLIATDDIIFTDRDMNADYQESESILISLEGNSASCHSPNVVIDGSTVTIAGGGTYILRGSLEGCVQVTAEGKKPRLVLDGAAIHNSNGAALLIQKADKVFVTLAQDSENTLTGDNLSGTDGVDGAVFSRQDLTFNGAGRLTVSSSHHGIVCKDDLVFTGGSYSVQAQNHGLDANDSVCMKDAQITVNAGKDAIHAQEKEDPSLGFVYISGGKLKLEAAGDGISAEAYLQFSGGEAEILAGGGNTQPAEDAVSTKGMKAAGTLLIAGGKVSINSADDGIHSDDSVSVSGGEVAVASGKHGVQAGNTLRILGGKVSVTESYEGMKAKDIVMDGGEMRIQASGDVLDYEISGTISGGTLVAVGQMGKAQELKTRKQGMVSLSMDGVQVAGTRITVTDADGNELLRYEPGVAFSAVIFSSPELVKGRTYGVSVGDSRGDLKAD